MSYAKTKLRPDRPRKPRAKGCYLGVPAVFRLELACMNLCQAFCVGPRGPCGLYLVGSVLERPDFRDVDVVCILDDAEFAALFPDCVHAEHGYFEHDPRWLVLSVAISDWLTKQVDCGRPVDFKFQPMTFANKRHPNHRSALGWRTRSRRLGKADAGTE